ncbi:hypothetical protein AM493_15570 [Flavobacterium akiainvivens]|uniref:Secretion system C-terminal sorting domain-containing protein n=1 Tax=Flavobacterium akiainvivens TaxID=1202724 RepID=A0A0M8MKC2_9FLAO|nr:T9SS sorting signal type C domain-containing protein [Flavobacterium akiainvivens]KOS07298.1 hypothetical protein AM493_15570 [Flavobacterium akiainvivens]SFQ46371.1 hypothetical protein SAMN05444144_10596 [Flavobacterium akiainvivens]
MKKALFLILLLPFIGLSQNASYNANELLVRWEGSRIDWALPSTDPMYYYNNTSGTISAPSASFTAANISGNGINFNTSNIYNGYFGSNWPTNSSPNNTFDYGKYYEVKLTAAANKQVELKNFRFKYGSNVNAYTIIYQKSSTGTPTDISFSTSGTVLATNTNAGSVSNQYLSYAFPSGFSVLAGETVYVRIYVYQVNQNDNQVLLVHNGAQYYNTNGGTGNSGSTGPALYGTVSAYSPVLLATDDAVSTNLNTAKIINVLANDVQGSSVTSVTITQAPEHGTAVVNGDKTITYTPATNYTGTDTFKYKAADATQNSIASVNITVQGTTPAGALSGVYYVGSYGHFATITAAVNHLNQYGVSGAVTFLLSNNVSQKVYNVTNGETFPITVTAFNNPNGNSVTFKPAPGKNVKIEAPRPYVAQGSGNGDSWAVPAVFKLFGASNIIIDGSNTANGTTRNLQIVNSSYAGNIIHGSNSNDYTDRGVIWIAPNGATQSNITVKYTVIKQLYKNLSDNFCMGIFAGSNYTFDSNEISHDPANALISNINIANNDFVNVKEAIFINGKADNAAQTVKIYDNDLGSETNSESVILPVSLNNVNGFDVYQNYIYKLYRDTNAASLPTGGINITGNSRNGNIYKNDIKDLKRITENDQIFAGIVLASTYTGGEMNIKVYNNFVLDVQAKGNGGGYSNGYGIVVDKGFGYKIYHNTVVLTPASNQPNGGYSAAFYVNENVTGLDVRNNIFVNTQSQSTTRRTAISVKNTSANINSVFTHLDYNNYYSSDRLAYIGVNNNVNITWPGEPGNENPGYLWTLDGWKSAIGSTANNKDVHTLNVNPSFVSATNLHINAYSAANNGIVDAGTNAIYSIVPKDIDGQKRKATTPDMGADEFGPVAMPTAGDPTGIYCDSATTWNGTSWSHGEPTLGKDVIFNGTFEKVGGTFNACSIYVLDGANVTFRGNAIVTVNHAINIATTGNLTIEHGTNLIQLEDEQNTGIAKVKRKTGLLKRLDYTLWSAPVTDYREGTADYQSLLEFSPLTSTSPSRFYFYDTAADVYTAYTSPQTEKFVTGKSALIRMPNSLPNISGYNEGTARTQYEHTFEGTLNNGTIRVPLSNAGNAYNGVGNPYPSPINITAFLVENALNREAIDGTIWLWRKTNNAAVISYATCTITGYVANTATLNADGTGGNTNAGNTIATDPWQAAEGGILNVGQGFVVHATGANKELVFKNNLRQNTLTSSFFRTQNDGTPEVAQNGKVWLNVQGGDNFAQILVAYEPVTTLGYDKAYDGEALTGGNLNMYSLMTEQDTVKQLAIQSRGNFEDTDTVALGFNAAAAGTYEIEIDRAQGVFAQGQKVYLKDNQLGITHNLNNGSYEFTSGAGTFNDRFVVVYVSQDELGTTTPVVDAKDVIVYRDAQQVKVTATENISAVTVYDMLGRTLFTQNNIDNTEFASANLAVAQQVVIVNVTLSNNQVVSKKIMMN